MTIKTFLQTLSTLKYKGRRVKWKKESGYIRSVGRLRGYCPLTAIAMATHNIKYPNSRFDQVGRVLGMSEKDIQVIADAADHRVNFSSDDVLLLRGRLLETCGLPQDRI